MMHTCWVHSKANLNIKRNIKARASHRLVYFYAQQGKEKSFIISKAVRIFSYDYRTKLNFCMWSEGAGWWWGGGGRGGVGSVCVSVTLIFITRAWFNLATKHPVLSLQIFDELLHCKFLCHLYNIRSFDIQMKLMEKCICCKVCL